MSNKACKLPQLSSQLSGSEAANEVDGIIPGHAPAPPWLTDLRHLVPLQVAFEEEVKEKDAVIAAYDKEIKVSFSLTSLSLALGDHM